MGFGLDAFGTAPFGIGTPVAAQPLPTGPAGSRYIGSVSGDYQVGPGGQLAQMPPLRQRVLLAVRTVKRSATLTPGLGIKMPTKLDGKTVVNVTNAVRSALYRLTDVERVMRVDAILVQKRPGGRVDVIVSFTDLTSGVDDTVTSALS